MHRSGIGRYLWEDTDQKVYNVQPTEMQSPPDKMLRRQMCTGTNGTGHPAISAQAEATTKEEKD